MKRHFPNLAIVFVYAAFAAVWVAVSGYLLTLVVTDPELLKRIELVKGLAFVVVSSGLLYVLLNVGRDEPRGTETNRVVPDPGRRHRAKIAIAILALIAPLLGLSVVSLYSGQVENDAKMDLSAIANLKAGQIESWLAERRGDATALAGSTGFVMRVANFQRAGGEKEREVIHDRLLSLQRAFDYDSITLVDVRAQPLLLVGQSVAMTAEISVLVAAAIRDRQIKVSELHSAPGADVHLDIIVPLLLHQNGAEVAQGAAVLRISAARFLYPLIIGWPTSSQSGESLLVRRDGDSVIYLNELRYDKNASLKLRVPLTETQVPAVQAVLRNKPGIISGKDYRGTLVLAAFRPVAGTTWHVIAKVDRAEILAPLYTLAGWIGLIALVAATAVGAALFALFRQQRVADLLSAQVQAKALFAKFYELPFVGLAVTSPSSKRWEQFNDQLCVILGYSRDELAQKTWTEITHPDDIDKDAAEFDRVMRGEIDGYTMEKRYIRKDGSVVFADINVRCLRGPGGQIESFFATVQDITVRKQAEARAQRLSSLYAALSECNAAIVRCANERDLVERICRIAVDPGGMKMAWIGFVDLDTGLLTPAASYGIGVDYLSGLQISVDPDSAFGRGPTGTAVRERRAIWCQDFQNEPSLAPWRETAARFGWGSSAAIPLRRSGIAVGALTLYNTEPNSFDDSAKELLLEIGTDLSFALDNLDREAVRQRAELALRESEARARALVHAIPDLIFTNKRDGEYLSVSASDPALLLQPSEKFLHKPVRDVLPSYLAERFMAAFGAALDTHELQQFDYALEMDGTQRHYEARVVPSEGETVISIVRDVTVQKREQAELEASEERFRGLVDQVISGIYIVQDGKIAYANRRFADIAGYASAEELIGRDALSLIAEPQRAFVAEQMRLRMTGEVPRGGYNTVGLRKDGSTRDVGIHGALATYGGKPAVVGMMQDITEKKAAEDRAARYLEQLQTAFMRTVEVATTISEMRDPYTAGHEKRVAKIAMAIGAELGLDASRIEGLRVAGYLHDVGKVTIPAEILAKPGKLSAVEYQLIKGHAQASYDILKDVEFPWPVAQIALQHHERINGSGYPQGLKGDQILLEARIMAVADTVEAMSSHRPYRPGLGKDKALAEIERGRGTIYDPVVADACLLLFREKNFALPE